MVTNDAQLTKCMNVLNGCAWKGGKLHISFAKANKFKTLEDGRIIFIKNEDEAENNKKLKIPKKKRKFIRHASGFSLVNDKNVDKRKGWRRGRYGRAIACLRIRRPNRQMLIIDPSHYKNNLEKLFGSVKPKPLSQLSWTITEMVNEVGNVDYNCCDDNDEVMECVSDNSEVFNVKNGSESDVEINVNMEPVPERECNEAFDVIQSETKVESNENYTNTEDPIEENRIIVNTVESQIAEPTRTEDTSFTPVPAVKSEAKFEVNVNWSSLFTSSAGESKSLFSNKVFSEAKNSGSDGFSLTSLIEKSSKIKNVSMDELFRKPVVPIESPVQLEKLQEKSLISSASESFKKVHNFANLFGDLNRITPTTAVRFGMHISRMDEMMQEWRIERIELKEDFKKRLAEGKRRNRRGAKKKHINK